MNPLDADCLLVVPPLAHLTWPSLAAHQLAACAREAGFSVRVLYASALYARMVGPLRYASLCNAPVQWLLGERLFARAAHGLPPLGRDPEDLLDVVDRLAEGAEGPGTRYVDHLTSSSGVYLEGRDHRLTREVLAECESLAVELVERVAASIAAADIPVVGATTTFDQTSAAVAILARVKSARPATLTLLGGANAHGDMAHGLRSVAPTVDCVVSGEAEAVFVELLRDWRGGDPRPPPVVTGGPCTDLDSLPPPSFQEYFEQVPEGLGQAPLWVLFETSRGCWWGERRRCTFCGLNPPGMGFRARDPGRVVEPLRQVLAEAPTHLVCMTDNAMPRAYHRSLVPQLARELPGVRLFYEQRPDLDLDQLQGLVDAGVRSIQPGIEALDSELLRLVGKGVGARQNLRLLRSARAVGMNLRWNLLYGIPGDGVESYESTLVILPLIHHLPPPQALAPIHLDRFSTYLEQPERFGITGLRPMAAYGAVFPPHADLDRLACHFEAEYPSASLQDPELVARLRGEVEAWIQAWQRPQVPALHARRIAPGTWQLVDTRDLGGPAALYLDDSQARAVLVGGPPSHPTTRWAVSRGYAVELDGGCAPLATTVPTLLAELARETG